jgi:hexosaminidase
LSAGDSVDPLRTLADVVTPATFGQRIRTHKYTQQTPLNRLVDAARPESEAARNFAALVDRMDRDQIRVWLTRWRDNDAQLKPLLQRSDLLREDLPVSEHLNRLAAIGLEALDYSAGRERPPDAWLAQQRVFLESCKKPQAELRIAILPSIEKLINAAASTP